LQEFLARIKPKQRKFFTELRSALLSLPEIEESLEIDEQGGDWCPAYRVRGGDLAWVHFQGRVSVSIPVEASFAKRVFQDENLDSRVVECVKEAEDFGEIKCAKVEVRSEQELDSVIPLLKLRHAHLMK